MAGVHSCLNPSNFLQHPMSGFLSRLSCLRLDGHSQCEGLLEIRQTHSRLVDGAAVIRGSAVFVLRCSHPLPPCLCAHGVSLIGCAPSPTVRPLILAMAASMARYSSIDTATSLSATWSVLHSGRTAETICSSVSGTIAGTAATGADCLAGPRVYAGDHSCGAAVSDKPVCGVWLAFCEWQTSHSCPHA